MIDMSELVAVQEYRENLVDVISHEFRTPLTVIQAYSQLITESADQLTPTQITNAKDRIRTSVAHLAYLLGSISELARLRAGAPAPFLQSLHSRELVREAVQALAARGRDVSRSVKVRVSAGAEQIEGEHQKVLIALVELIDNAAKFSKPGEPIFVEVRLDGDEYVLTVEDRGPGITEELRDAVFQPFVQGDMTAARPAKGAGLGLAVVSGLVGAQGGRLELESVVGEGSAFHIVLPRRGAVVVAPEAAQVARTG
jgi:signal transduction histidine kinase